MISVSHSRYIPFRWLICHVRFILNVCMPYTSRDEITTAVEACVRTAVGAGRNAKPYVHVFYCV